MAIIPSKVLCSTVYRDFSLPCFNVRCIYCLAIIGGQPRRCVPATSAALAFHPLSPPPMVTTIPISTLSLCSSSRGAPLCPDSCQFSLSLIASRDSLSVVDSSAITVPPHASPRCCLHSATIVTNTCYAIGKSISTTSFIVDLDTVLESIRDYLTTHCLVAYIS